MLVLNIFVIENLTPMNESIAFNCRKLKRSGLSFMHVAVEMVMSTLKRMKQAGHSKRF